MFKMIIITISFFICSGLPSRAQSDAQPKTFARFEKLASAANRSSITGVQLKYQRGERIENFNYGKSSTNTNEAVTDTTVFEAASLSKLVTAYLCLLYVDSGLINPDTPLYNYYAYPRIENNEQAKKVTARMALSHTGGFPNWTMNPGGRGWAESKLTTKFNPGSAWSYSGEGFVFIQRVLEKISGQSFNELAQQNVFRRFGMKHSSFTWNDSIEKLMAYGHDEHDNESQRNKIFQANGAASLLTTADDYTAFIQGLIKGLGLKPETHDLMFTKQATPDWFGQPKNRATKYLGWGLGVGLEKNAHGDAIWHWGDNGDFKCFVIAFPKSNESLVVFTNDERGMKMMDETLQLYFNEKDFWSLKWLN